MSARGYFDLRNAIPGFVFILIVLAINHIPLMEILQEQGFADFFGAFLAFSYLLSGGAIGFIISQGWWWYWQRHAGILGDQVYNEAVDAFCTRYEVNPPKDIRERRRLVTAMDYADHTRIDEDHKELLTLAERRWDMFHTLSSTLLASFIGLAFAMIVRFSFWIIKGVAISVTSETIVLSLIYVITKGATIIVTITPRTIVLSLVCIITKGAVKTIVTSETIVLSFICFIVFIFMYLVNKGRIWTRQMSADLTEAIFRTIPIDPNTLRRAFPHLPFNQDNPEPDEDLSDENARAL